MIEIKEIMLNPSTKKAMCNIYADTKEEVQNGGTPTNLPTGYTIDSGSTLYTANLDVAVMKSDGTWKWN